MDLSEAMKIKDPDNVVRHPWEIARQKIITYLLSEQKSSPFFHLMDVGSGDGFILRQLLQNKIALYFTAVDTGFSRADIERMKAWPSSENLRLYKDIREIDPDSGGPVDCILLLDVLEHAPDDNILINEIFKNTRVAKNAKWLITVPAFQSLFSKHDKQLKHYRRYNLKQLSSLCNKCGLQIDQGGYFFFSLIPLRFIQKIVLKISDKEKISTIENWKGGKLPGKILQAILWIDFRICLLLSKLSINIPGLSCYCICH